jgi:rubrerythrin
MNDDRAESEGEIERASDGTPWMCQRCGETHALPGISKCRSCVNELLSEVGDGD